MLVRVKRSQGGPETAEEGRQPEELASETFEISDRASAGIEHLIGQSNQTAEFGRVQADGKALEVHLPANPQHGRGKSTLVPAHRNLEAEKQDNNHGSPKRGGEAIK